MSFVRSYVVCVEELRDKMNKQLRLFPVSLLYVCCDFYPKTIHVYMKSRKEYTLLSIG